MLHGNYIERKSSSELQNLCLHSSITPLFDDEIEIVNGAILPAVGALLLRCAASSGCRMAARGAAAAMATAAAGVVGYEANKV